MDATTCIPSQGIHTERADRAVLPSPLHLTQAKRLPNAKHYERNLESRYRRPQYRDFGGRTWCNVIIASGDVDTLIITLLNKIIDERRALATTQGLGTRRETARLPREERPGPIYGVMHEVSGPKQARQEAKRLDAQLRKENEMWYSPSRAQCMPWNEWKQLRKNADEAWSKAERLSYDAGFAFTDRNGVRQLGEPRDMVGLALRSWCERMAVQYS
jgi:hypothetical protein